MACRVSSRTWHVYMVPSGAVMMHDLSCKMLLTIPQYHRLLGGVLYITWVPIGNRLLVHQPEICQCLVWLQLAQLASWLHVTLTGQI